MTPARLPFFVYGTLRPGEVNHDLFLRGRIRAEEPGRLAGALLYDGPGYPYAVEEAGGVVMGELVTPQADAYTELLAVLDELEEYTPGDPRNLYERVAREVIRTADGTPVRAWVYVAAPPRRRPPARPRQAHRERRLAAQVSRALPLHRLQSHRARLELRHP